MNYYLISKRITDILFSVGGLIVLSPIIVLTAIAIKIFSPGPVLFKQQRIGQHNKLFNIFKFRTMKVGADKTTLTGKDIRILEMLHDDARITKIGKLLRRYGIDEIPQLINILIGDMSFVGPRPYTAQRLAAAESSLIFRTSVKPGLTSLVVINGGVNLSEKEMASLDWRYIIHRSFWFDISIFLKTILFVLSGIGFNQKNHEQKEASGKMRNVW
jgi:lipopolysaccharide/colanic/teichoic acid biosynthesis glycosyltransferase